MRRVIELDRVAKVAVCHRAGLYHNMAKMRPLGVIKGNYPFVYQKP